MVIASLLVVVLVPLAANTIGALLVTVWTGRVQTTAQQWIADTPGASIVGVEVEGKTVTVQVQAPGELPPVSGLVADLQGQIPNGTPVFVTTSVGQRIEAGVVGS